MYSMHVASGVWEVPKLNMVAGEVAGFVCWALK